MFCKMLKESAYQMRSEKLRGHIALSFRWTILVVMEVALVMSMPQPVQGSMSGARDLPRDILEL
jgi:hypothetical protein